MLDKLDAEFAFGREALDVRAYRQELLSSNIANADTPGYKARDVDFASSLAGALKKSGGATGTAASNNATLAMTQPAGVTSGMSMVSTAPGHMAGKSTLTPTGGTSDDYGNLQYRDADPTRARRQHGRHRYRAGAVRGQHVALRIGHDGAVRPDQNDAVGDPVGLVRSQPTEQNSAVRKNNRYGINT